MRAVDKISLRQIRYFQAICEHGSFSTAARLLRVSQPALGLQIKHLEGALGTALFERHARGVTPTRSGMIFLRHTKRALDALTEAEEAIVLETRLRPLEILMGITTTGGKGLVSALMEEAAACKPQYHLSFHEGMSDDLLKMLALRQLQASLCYRGEEPIVGSVLPLYRDEFVLVAKPRVLGNSAKRISFRKLSQYPLVVGPPGQGSRQFLEQEAVKRGGRIHVDIEMSSLSLKHEMVFRHDKCMIVPYGRFLSEVQSGTLGMVRINPPLFRTMILAIGEGVSPRARDELQRIVKRCVASRIAEGNLGWLDPER